MVLNLQVMLQHDEWWNEGYDGAGVSIRTDRDRKEQIYIPLLPRGISWTVAGTVTLFSPALNRLRHILYKRTAKLDDLVNQANISMLKAIHIFFYGLILTGSLDDNASEFIHTFVGEANPRKQRKALLKKLKTPDSTLPWLFSLYPTWKRCIIVNPDGRSPQRYTSLRDVYSVN